MTQDEGQAGGKTPGEQAREGVDDTGLAGPERADAESTGEGGAPTGAGDSDPEDAPGSTEEGAQLQEQIIETARRMSADSPSGDVDGEDIARECGLEPTDPAVYDALQAASQRAELACQGWRPDNGLPTRVRADTQPSTESDA